MSRRQAWYPALRVAASVAALAVVAAVVGEQAVRSGAAVLSPGPVLAALGLGALWRALAATRWVLLARLLGAPLAWPGAFAEYLRSELVNQVVPGGVVGDVDRARRHGGDVGLLPAARAVVGERVVGQLVLVVAVALTLLVRPELLRVRAGADDRTAAVVAALLVVVAALAVALWQPWRARAHPGRRPAERVAPVPSPGRSPVRVAATLAACVALSVAVLGCFVTLFVLAARTTGTTAAAEVLVPAVLVVLLVSGIPLTVAGWGAREAGAALCFAAVGLAAADGVAAAVGYGLLSLLSALPGVVPLLLPRTGTGRTSGTGGTSGTSGTSGRRGRAAQVEVEADVLAEPERP